MSLAAKSRQVVWVLATLVVARCSASVFSAPRRLVGSSEAHLRGPQNFVELRVTEGAEDVNEDSTPPKMLFIGVISAPEDLAKRDEIRSSWMQGPLIDVNGTNVEVKFFYGKADPTLIEPEALQREQEQNKDVVVLPIEEGRDNLSNKTITFLRWVVQRRGASKFIMKLDDDTYPHLERIMPALKRNLAKHNKTGDAKNYAIMGHFHNIEWGKEVMREGRYAEDPQVYSKNKFPRYPGGSGYILSKDLAKTIAVNHYERNIEQLIHNEDANLGVWIHRDVQAGNLETLSWVSLPSEISGCNTTDAISMNLRPLEMKCMWNNKQKGVEDICCKDDFPHLAFSRQDPSPKPPDEDDIGAPPIPGGGLDDNDNDANLDETTNTDHSHHSHKHR